MTDPNTESRDEAKRTIDQRTEHARRQVQAVTDKLRERIVETREQLQKFKERVAERRGGHGGNNASR